MEQLLDMDTGTYEHSIRVGALAKAMAVAMKLDKHKASDLVKGCFLHDIGKLQVPIELLNKNSGLLPEEWEVMKLHPSVGARLIREHSDIHKEIIDIIEFHHERWDGSGYPYGLRGKEIPDLARICAILDSYDCMISDRAYRSRLTAQEAKEQLKLHAGRQFDEQYVNVFIRMLEGMTS